jgi:hypothetical protein
MVDTSGSNAQATNNTCTTSPSGICLDPPSDPSKSFRVNGIKSFLSQYQSSANFSWGLLTFSNDSIQDLTGSGGTLFTSSSNVMLNAINNLQSIQDNGDTPYQLAFTAAQQAIAADPQLGAANYFLILETDGYPTDFYDNNGNVQTQAVLAAVTSLVGASPGHVALSTLYYHNGPSDPTASGLLQQMAQTGGGEFADINTANNTGLAPIGQLVSGNCQ